ncbi:MAG: FAD-binding oxidoreductase [Clostridiales bacterium]|nr:FAD-binding oxidoreductase [Clostridiales bacterium]
MKTENIMPQYQSFLSDESQLSGYSNDIVFASNINDICDILKQVNKEGNTVTVQGARTGVVGGAVPQGGLVLNLSKMNQIRDKTQNEKSSILRVQAGVTLEQIEEAANADNLFFAPNPTEPTATIGGIFASNALGPNSLFYGASSTHIQALSWITPKGERWALARGDYRFKANKCLLPDGTEIVIPADLQHSPVKIFDESMDLIDFLAGSEGALGLAAEFELRLLPLPKEIWGVVYFFSKPEQASAFAKKLFEWNNNEHHAALTAAEFYDQGVLELIDASRQDCTLLKALPPFPANVSTAIYTELFGDDSDLLEEALMQHLDYFSDVGGKEENTWAESGFSSIRRFRELRHAIPSLLNEMVTPGLKNQEKRWETDFSGSPEMFDDFLKTYNQALSDFGLKGLIYGHVLQNKMHLALLPETTEQQSICKDLVYEISQWVMQNDGFLITENGIGLLKQSLVHDFMPPMVWAAIEKIRLHFDPNKTMKYPRKVE